MAPLRQDDDWSKHLINIDNAVWPFKSKMSAGHEAHALLHWATSTFMSPQSVMHVKNPARLEEADLLDTQLAELDDEIHAILTERAKVRHRYNTVGARVNALPPETLAIIFQYACDLPDTANLDDKHRAVSIGSVCVRWHEVAHSVPEIWDRACIFVKNSSFMSVASFSLLRLYIKNLGNRGMNLRLSLVDEDTTYDEDEEGDESDVPLADVFRYIFGENAAKLNALFMNDFSEEWATLFIESVDVVRGFPNLTRLHMGWKGEGETHDRDWDSPPPLEPKLIPNLFYVSFAQTAPPFLIPHEQITELYFEYVAVDKCLVVMAQCPNTTELHVSYSEPAIEWAPDSVLTRQVTLHRTTCLGWTFGLQRWDIVFLKLFSFPAMERFRCQEQGPNGLEEDEENTEVEEIPRFIKEFLARSPRLTTYVRMTTYFEDWTISDLCDNLPDTIEQIWLEEVDADECKEGMIKLTRRDDDIMKILPRLTFIELQGGFWSHSTFDEIFDGLVDMIESRLREPSGMKNHARLESVGLLGDRPSGKSPHALTEKQEARLQAFVNEGLELTTCIEPGLGNRVWSSK